MRSSHTTVIGGLKSRIVYVVTSEKFIQAVLSGSAFAIINKSSMIFGAGVASPIGGLLGETVLPQTISLLIALCVFAAAFWADNHLAWFRAWIAEETGEKPADDEES